MKIKDTIISIFSRGTPSEKYFKLLISIFFILQFSFLNLQCKKPTPPDVDDTPKPGKRDYTWTIDTLAAPGSMQTIMQAIWGTSAQNVYVVGYNEVARGTIYHYDGNRWKEITLPFGPGQSFRKPPQLYDIHGTSSSDIFAVGMWSRANYDSINDKWIITDSSFIMHYNGINWSEHIVHDGGPLFSVWYTNTSSAWAGGADGVMFKFDGVNWLKYQLPQEYSITSIAALSTADVYAVGNRIDWSLPLDSTGYFLFHYDGFQWQKIDSVIEIPGSPTAHFGRNLWSDGQTLYSIGSGIFRKQGNQWIQISDNPYVGHMFKSGENNIIAVGKSVFHYNSLVWKEYTQFNVSPPLGWFDCFSYMDEVFVVGNNNSITIVLHGKAKE